VKKDRSQEAYAILMQIHGGLGEDFINREFAQMHEQITAEGNSGFLDCFRTKSAWTRMALGIFINVFNNLGGTPVISVYQSTLFKQMGFTGLRTLYLSGFYGLAGLVGVIINITLVADRMGRKTSMIWGAITLLVDLVILMPLSKIYTGSTNLAGAAATVTFIFLHSFVYSIFMFGTVWVYTTEIFPTHLRAKGTAICIFAGQVIALVLQQIGLIVFNDIGYWFYLVFIVCTAVALAVYYFYLPETMGVTLEDISAFFGDEVIATLHESKTRIEAIMLEVAGDESTGIAVEPRTVTSADA
jgi:Sugar (and other) transporter